MAGVDVGEEAMEILDLSGVWRYQTDEEDTCQFGGERFPDSSFMLPGSACDNHVGKRQAYYERFSREAVRAPRERYEYIAPLWLQREIEIPEELEGKSVRLFLERVNIASELWFDDVKIARQNIELSAPHIYNLTGKITVGLHRITLRIDNRNLLNIGDMASGYSVDTQGYWNGIIGRIELQYEDIYHIEDVQVYPGDKGIDIRLVTTSDIDTPSTYKEASVELYATAPDGEMMTRQKFAIKLYHTREVSHLRYEMNKIRWWSEFQPMLYTLHIKYMCDDRVDEKTVRFGMRTIRTEGRRILLNNRQISLRGTTECAIDPLTGYPPMDAGTWRKRFQIIQSYGLNHVRFHAWCPPESAFTAADELGIYLSVEMPLWLNHDISDIEAGDDPVHRQYFMQEALTISRTYGNHPSFLMFSNGNENMGDFALLEDITTCVKAYDSRRIYTLTSNFDHTIMPCEDYLCAFEAGGRRVRIQVFHDEIASGTWLNYADAVENVSVPVVSFEVGQYCVYPDVDLIERYSGNMLPVNFDVIRKRMIEKGVYHRRLDYIRASGSLAVKLYKEDIEAALRTRDLGGFELLSLCDYTGQSTATVGLLNVFYENKGFIAPEQFRQFCGDVVPLFQAKRIYTNDELLEAELALYDFGAVRITDPEYNVVIRDNNGVFYQCATKDTKLCVSLAPIKHPTQLTVTVAVGEYRNEWRIFVFMASSDEDCVSSGKVRYIRTPAQLDEIRETGGRAIVTGECFEQPVKGSFIPVFWSPVHFPTKRACGAIIDEKHSVFRDFPTERYPDYQWKRLLENSVWMDVSAFHGCEDRIVEIVPNFVDNTQYSPLFEVKTGKAQLLYCGFDLDGDYPEARQLRRSIENYSYSLAQDFTLRCKVREKA